MNGRWLSRAAVILAACSLLATLAAIVGAQQLVVSPDSIRLRVGDTARVVAAVRGIPGAALAFTGTDAAIFTAHRDGRITARALGCAWSRVSYGTWTRAQVPVCVVAAPEPAPIPPVASASPCPADFQPITRQTWPGALPVPPATAYTDGWAIANNTGTDYDIRATQIPGALRFTITAGVSGNGGGPRAERSFAPLRDLCVSFTMRLSATSASWGPNAYKVLSLQGTRILSLLRTDYAGRVPLGHYFDFVNGGSFYLNDVPATGRGTLTAVQGGVWYQVQLLLESTGRVRWWVRNLDAGTPAVLQGDYAGQPVGTFNYLALLGQQGGFALRSAPTSFTDDRGPVTISGRP